MRVQRIIASVLLSVLLLTPLAPALVTQAETAAQHCVRPTLAHAASQQLHASGLQSSGMQCHEGMPHAMAESSQSSDDSKPKSDHQFGSNRCCTSHDCCNSTVRSQWAQSSPSVFTTVEPTQILSALPIFSTPQSLHFILSRGRAPPAL
jgi:hypothetical protein